MTTREEVEFLFRQIHHALDWGILPMNNEVDSVLLKIIDKARNLPTMSEVALHGYYNLYFELSGYNLEKECKLFSELTGLPNVELEIDQEFGTSCYGTYTLQESPTLDTIESIVGDIKRGLDKSTKAKNPKRVTFTYSIILQYLMLKGMLPHKVLFQIEY